MKESDGSERQAILKVLLTKLLLYELRKQIVIQFSRLPDGLDNDFKKQRDIESVIWVDTGSE